MGRLPDIVGHPEQWTDAYTADDRAQVGAVLDWLARDDVQERGWHRASLARAAAVNRGRVYQVLGGTYPSSPTETLRTLWDVIRRDELRAQEAVGPVAFVETSVYRLVVAACHRAHLYRGIAMVSAYVGTGKTTAVKHYAASHANVYLVEATPDMNSSILLAELVEKTGAVVSKTRIHGRGTKAEMMHGLVRALAGTDSLVILDEAETVSTQTLEYVRRLRDKCGIGVVLSGTEKLMPLIRDPRGRFGQVSSRVIFWPPVIKAITREDCHALAETAFGPDVALSDEVLDACWQMCDGSARVLTEALIPGVRDYGLRKGTPLTAELVFKVGQEVLGFRRPARRA